MPVPNENIRPAGDFINNNYDMKLFAAALKKTGLTNVLNEDGPFTVLVPSDLAFNKMGVMRQTDFDRMNLDSLKKMLSYHIMPRKLYLADIPTNGVDVRYQTLVGTPLYASLASLPSSGGSLVNDLYFDGAETNRKDIQVSNGVLHVLNKVMKPQFETTVQGFIAKDPSYSVFVEGLKKFGLWDQLATPTRTFTVFAPTNEALAKIGITSAILKDFAVEKYLGDLLFGGYLIYDKHFFISDADVFRVISGKGQYEYPIKDTKLVLRFNSGVNARSYTLAIRSDNGGTAAGYSPITFNNQAMMDYGCSNGVVHHLDKGLVKPAQAIKK